MQQYQPDGLRTVNIRLRATNDTWIFPSEFCNPCFIISFALSFARRASFPHGPCPFGPQNTKWSCQNLKRTVVGALDGLCFCRFDQRNRRGGLSESSSSSCVYKKLSFHKAKANKADITTYKVKHRFMNRSRLAIFTLPTYYAPNGPSPCTKYNATNTKRRYE